MTYAQKSSFGQNWAKIKKKYFGNYLHIEVNKKEIKPKKYCLTDLFF
jgi:hypothetical protein